MTKSLSDTARYAERCVLGSMLRDNACIAEVVQLLRKEAFSVDAHIRLFDALTTLYERGTAADMATVADLLRQRGELADVPYVLLADLLEEAPSAANVVYHARLVREAFICRELARAAAEIQVEAQNPTAPADDVLAQAEQQIFAIADIGVIGAAVPLATAVKESCDRIETRLRRSTAELSGVATGYADLDEMTAGFQDSELILLAARPSVGKTALGLSIARNVAVLRQEPVFFASLEQGRTELAERLMCSQAGVDSQRVRHGRLNSEECASLASARDILDSAPLFLDDSGRQSVLRIAANARRLKARHGLRLLIIDYLGLIEPANRKDPRQEQIACISRSLKLLAKDLRVPVLCLAQLNRQVEYRTLEKPKLADLRDSGAQEQDADTVMLMWRPEESGCRVEIIVAKQRNGPIGDVSLAFRKEFVRFENFAHEPDFAHVAPPVNGNGRNGQHAHRN